MTFMGAADQSPSVAGAGHAPSAAARLVADGFVPDGLKLTEHFSVTEFTFSETASRAGIDNRLPERLLADAERTAQLLERIRSFLSDLAGREIPMDVTSGYRCIKLNQALRSDNSSDHVIAHAADWRARSFGTPFQIACALVPYATALGIGQLIHEFGSWVHVGRRAPIDPINRVITIDHQGTRAGILPARPERRA